MASLRFPLFRLVLSLAIRSLHECVPSETETTSDTSHTFATVVAADSVTVSDSSIGHPVVSDGGSSLGKDPRRLQLDAGALRTRVALTHPGGDGGALVPDHVERQQVAERLSAHRFRNVS